jgi:hypothetical protein
VEGRRGASLRRKKKKGAAVERWRAVYMEKDFLRHARCFFCYSVFFNVHFLSFSLGSTKYLNLI